MLGYSCVGYEYSKEHLMGGGGGSNAINRYFHKTPLHCELVCLLLEKKLKYNVSDIHIPLLMYVSVH